METIKKKRKTPVRKKLTEEQKRIFKQKCEATKKAKYGDPHYNNHNKADKTKEERYGDKNYNNTKKHQETCLEKYGETSYNKTEEGRARISKAKSSDETQAKFEKTMLDTYGYSNPNLVPEIRAKYEATLLNNYGVTNPLKNKDIKNKQIETMRENGTFNTSEPEEQMYMDLCNQYGKDDVFREYNSDSRYPYKCDFYIKSEDKFIELNLHPSHCKHPFVSTDVDDLKLLEDLKSKNDEWSNMIIDVWTRRDVEKRKCAEANNLNYEMIYDLK